MSENRGDEMLEFELFGWLPCLARTAYGWVFSDKLDNAHSDIGADFSQIKSINHSGAIIIGTLDGFSQGDGEHFIRLMASHIKNGASVGLIKDARHNFMGKEKELASEILQILKGWELDFA